MKKAEEAKKKAEAEAKKKAEEEAKKKAEAEAKKKAEEEAKKKAEAEAKKKAEEEAKKKAEAEAKKKAEEEAKKKAEAEAKKKAEEEAKKKAEAEARKKAEAEARRKAEEEARRKREQSLEDDILGSLDGPGGSSQSGTNAQLEMAQRYGMTVKSIIEEAWHVEKAMNGKTVNITIRLSENGSISGENCTGDSRVCQSVRQALDRIHAFPAPPKECSDCRVIHLKMTPRI